MKPFKPRQEYKYIGKYTPRLVDGRKKASGAAEFFDDICQPNRFPGMLYAKVLTSPYPHARIRRIDTTRAQALPGVHAILTCFDPDIRALPLTSHAWAGVGSTVSVDRWQSLRYNDQRILGDTFHCYGDKNGAVVAAESEQIAEEALKLLDIEWEILPFYLDPDSAMQPGAHPIHPEINPDGNILPPDPRDPNHPIELEEEITAQDTFYSKGDVEQGFARL